MHPMDSDRKLTETPPQHLVTAVEEAELLVHFSQRNGKRLDPQLIEGIVNARTLLDEGKLIGASESEFHICYNHLAEASLPVTVGSIQDSVLQYGETRPAFVFFGPPKQKARAERTIGRYRNLACFALFLLLVVQIYWLVGAKLITDIESLKEKISEKDGAKNQVSPGMAEKSAGVKTAELLTNTSQVQARFNLLEGWYSFWLDGPDNAARETNKPPSQTKPEDEGNAWQKPGSKTPEDQARIFVQASQRVDILQIYFLPLLYGLIGAIAYVLRELINETRSRTFQGEAMPAYQLRLFLGTLSGLAIGWFFQSKTVTLAGSALTPMALSFLAGYSVEVLFSGMDKIVQSFGSESKKSPS
jgi:hypothetical protein